jgi:hypothetical protein
MRITTRSAIDISESLAQYMLSCYIYYELDEDPQLEKRMNYVYSGQFSRSDIYYSKGEVAVEVKSTSHGVECLKGVLQASIYKEQVDRGLFCMQRPKRKALRETLEGMCRTHGVGLLYIESVPTVCTKKSIEKATGGYTKPFELWRSNRFTTTRSNIISNSKSGWADDFMETLDQIILECQDEIFNFKIRPDDSKPGLNELHSGEDTDNKAPVMTVGDF